MRGFPRCCPNGGFTVIPKFFNPPFGEKLQVVLQGAALPLSYRGILKIKSLVLIIARKLTFRKNGSILGARKVL